MDEENKTQVTKKNPKHKTENIKTHKSQIMKKGYSFGAVEKEGNIT